MACLGSVLYDPATAASVSTASLAAMTALDTTNARITFTAPANGNVLVRIRIASKGATNAAALLLGVLDGATVRGRQSPITCQKNSLAQQSREVTFLVTGLTPGNSYTWDAAYAVQVVVASSVLAWGGPNDTTTSNASGAISYEIWSTENLLAGTMYDPAVAVSQSTASLLAMTALDTTNLRLSFTVPASGRVLVRLRSQCTGGSGSAPSVLLGVLEGATVRGRSASWTLNAGSVSATDPCVMQSEFVVSGLTPAANLTWDAAYGVETVVASTNIKYGGPNDATGADAYGGFSYEIWSA